MSKYIPKSHTVSVLMYHAVCPAKYRRAVFTEDGDAVLKDVCLDIAKRYEIVFLEIGTDHDHVHFVLQSVPTYSPTKIVQTVKRMTAREVFQRVPSVKQQLWGGACWSSGYFIKPVGRHGSEAVIQHYVQQQGRTLEYQRLHAQQLTLWSGSSNDGTPDTPQLAAGPFIGPSGCGLIATPMQGSWVCMSLAV